jgi:hypothetical protein
MRQPSLQIIGAAAILDRPKVALFCSVKCPGMAMPNPGKS